IRPRFSCPGMCKNVQQDCKVVFQILNITRLLPDCTIIDDFPGLGPVPYPDNEANCIAFNETTLRKASEDSTLTCPEPFVFFADALSPSQSKLFEQRKCLGSCCVPCPFNHALYPVGWWDTSATAMRVLRMISTVCLAYVFISYLVLPGKRQHPSVTVLYLTGAALGWQLAVVFAIPTTKQTFVWNSNLVERYYRLIQVICWGAPFGLLVYPVSQGSINYRWQTSCFLDPETAVMFFFEPLAVMVYPCLILHLITVGSILKVALQARNRKQSSIDSQSRPTEIDRIIAALSLQWRALVFALGFGTYFTLHWLYNFLEVRKITSTLMVKQLIETSPPAWLQIWIGCVFGGNGQNACFEQIKGFIPDFWVGVLADVLTSTSNNVICLGINVIVFIKEAVGPKTEGGPGELVDWPSNDRGSKESTLIQEIAMMLPKLALLATLFVAASTAPRRVFPRQSSTPPSEDPTIYHGVPWPVPVPPGKTLQARFTDPETAELIQNNTSPALDVDADFVYLTMTGKYTSINFDNYVQIKNVKCMPGSITLSVTDSSFARSWPTSNVVFMINPQWTCGGRSLALFKLAKSVTITDAKTINIKADDVEMRQVFGQYKLRAYSDQNLDVTKLLDQLPRQRLPVGDGDKEKGFNFSWTPGPAFNLIPLSDIDVKVKCRECKMHGNAKVDLDIEGNFFEGKWPKISLRVTGSYNITLDVNAAFRLETPISRKMVTILRIFFTAFSIPGLISVGPELRLDTGISFPFGPAVDFFGGVDIMIPPFDTYLIGSPKDNGNIVESDKAGFKPIIKPREFGFNSASGAFAAQVHLFPNFFFGIDWANQKFGVGIGVDNYLKAEVSKDPVACQGQLKAATKAGSDLYGFAGQASQILANLTSKELWSKCWGGMREVELTKL
ncbi:hypothetical protein HK102_007435, partial [Quaeritorhiza haematococci]